MHDRREDADVMAAFARITQETRTLDILVNNVWGGYKRMIDNGVFTWSKPFWEQPLWRWDAMFNAGVRAQYRADTLVVRCALDDRDRFLEDAPDTYYVTDYYRPYQVVLVRLSHLDRDALRELLSVSRPLGMQKARRPTRRQSRTASG